MKTVFTIAAALISTATLLGASSANASGYDQYRRTVLGDTTVAAPATPTRTVLVAGSYAQYLINNGATKQDALAAAAQVGEQQRYDSVAIEAPKAKLTPLQAYAKSIGNDVPAGRNAEVVMNAE
ncbi:hypothetical protein SNE35_19645 [Paucibacter sp. R3-3]|uniref:DUF4148 domain-containing protein n=1 Tax=Roseateles agri TaxID=3098619 RepID=A0ABU5DKB1_9BURK|nr:hypothetical protein [Paucibacter sp. R3-3]MDY0746735.1 hypothetical protein [Paucibacter sp. R3-3]